MTSGQNSSSSRFAGTAAFSLMILAALAPSCGVSAFSHQHHHRVSSTTSMGRVHSRSSLTTSAIHMVASDKAPKHDVGGGANFMDQLTPEQQQRVQAFMDHQQNVPKIGFPTDVRSLVQYNHGFAVMSTNSKNHPGYPGVSVVGFAPDDEGRPLFVFSGMSSHTVDILTDPKCSLTVADKKL